MSLRFTKMHGLGNDFVIVDSLTTPVDITKIDIKKLADRRTGIGFDQLLLIGPPPSKEYDCTYRIYNADGKEVEQCGNGARCIGHYIFSEKSIKKKMISLATLAGKIELQREADGQITVNMGKPRFEPTEIPLVFERQQSEYEFMVAGQLVRMGAVSVGNPHAVILVTDTAKAPIDLIGSALQAHHAFPNQVNVGFMQVINPSYVRLRVFERGVGETLACGSGACAAVVIGRMNYGLQETVQVELPGGILTISWEKPCGDIFLTGPAETVFKGELV